MAFKLKSPFHAEVKTVGKQFGDGKAGIVGQGSSGAPPVGIENTRVDLDSNTSGDQGLEKEQKTNEKTKELTEKAEKGVPVSLNPKQKARLETQKYKKGIEMLVSLKDKQKKLKKFTKEINLKNYKI